MLAAPFGDLSPRCNHHQKWQRLERKINASIRGEFPIGRRITREKVAWNADHLARLKNGFDG